jgi:hypothetical protein
MPLHKIVYFCSEGHLPISYIPYCRGGSGHYTFIIELNKIPCIRSVFYLNRLKCNKDISYVTYANNAVLNACQLHLRINIVQTNLL